MSIFDNWSWPQWLLAAIFLGIFLGSFSDEIALGIIKRERTAREFQINNMCEVFFLLWITYAGGFWK